MMTATKLRELEFSDLYLGHPTLSDCFADVPGARENPMRAYPALREDLDNLGAACRAIYGASPQEPEFTVRHDGVLYRVAAMRTQGGTVFGLRKLSGVVRSLTELGIPQAYFPHLLRDDLSGLLVISGAAGAGKTMTACALVRERLAAHGGVAVTRERRIELPLEGEHGHGICFQVERGSGADDEQCSLHKLVRFGARLVYVDEVNDSETAVEVLQASANGQLIVTTMLAESVVQAIARLHALVQERIATNDARTLLVEGLLGVLHQRLARDSKPALQTEFLFAKDAPHVKATLRDGNYNLLESELQRQMTSLIVRNAARQVGVAGHER